MADQYWGARARWSYAWKSQYDSGARVIFGSDAPVESPDPWLGIFAATTRQPLVSQSNTLAWIPEERVSLEQAILWYTKNPAQTSAWKGRIGQLTAGYAADLIVLDQDPFELDQEAIANLRPAGVMSAGEWQIREF
jgi:predicted amidohydrolase YtcJ